MKALIVAARSLRKAPVFAAVAIVSLALAIGPNAAIFALIDAVLLRPLPAIAQPEQLASIYLRSAQDPKAFSSLSWQDFEYYRKAARSFSSLSAYLRLPMAVRFGDRVENISGELVSDNYLRTLGVPLRLGRDLGPDEKDRVALIGERMWRERFGSDPKIVGRSIRIGDGTFTVIGVVAAEFRGIVLDWGDRPQFWVSMRWYRDAVPALAAVDVLNEWGMRSFVVTGRLRPGISPAQAAAEVESIGRDIEAAHPERARGATGTWVATTMPLGQARFWPGARSQVVTVLLVLMVVAASVLLIACANLASLLLTRAAQREREISVRIALGARAPAVLRLLLAESFLLSLGGCAAGLLAGVALTRGLASFPKLFSVPLAVDPAVDWRVIAFSGVLGLLVTVLVGVAPLRQCMGHDLASALRAAGAASRRSHLWNTRNILTAAQIALSFLLLVQAGLFLRTFHNAAESESFLHAGNLFIAGIGVPQPDQARAAKAILARELPARAREMPAVQDAVLSSVLPLSGMRSVANVTILNPATGTEPIERSIDRYSVSPGFLGLTGSVLLRGRDFADADAQSSAGVALVNQQMADRYWGGDAMGKHFRQGGEVMTVIGVVRDQWRRSYRLDVPPRVYVPIARDSAGPMFLVVKAHGNPLQALGPLRSLVSQLAPDATLDSPQTLASYTSAALAPERLAAWCLGALAFLALTLSLVGIYGTVAYSVAQRKGEIGIRLALGATSAGIVRSILQPVAVVSAVGLVSGAVLCAATIQLSESLLFGVTGTDASTWGVVGLSLAAAALAAASLPALVASRVDPALVLRGN
ncbi:ADOP family duplicated permease [uncultured Paludibaculum sp.]|uniref:ADOP family duplicated permease n=1 Tax=uncultured Paludibaculum sp. TaxID=1765020 RepID=UPI002AABF179|nr:ADOP family duplicated permease [uncultured Paludibaculum sp.]